MSGADAGLTYRHGDHLGSTSMLSDAAGAKVEGSAVVYAPFGEVRAGELSALTDFGFTGQRLDRSAGELMYYGARYYLPSLRRFISADTIVPGLSPQLLNRYTYVANNPVKYIDPTGHRLSMNGKLWMPTVHRAPVTPAPRSPLSDRTSILTLTLHFTQELERYGVQVENQSSSASDFQVVSVLHQAVQSMAEQAVETIRVATFNLGGQRVSKYEAFAAVFGSTEVTVKTGMYVNSDEKWFGSNNGYYDGIAQIEIASDPLMGIGGHEGNMGVNIVAHEFGHNLTNQGIAAPSQYVMSSFYAVDASSVNVRTYDNPKTEENEDNYGTWLAEQSADAFAGWSLGSYNDESLQWEGYTSNQVDFALSRTVMCAVLSFSCSY